MKKLAMFLGLMLSVNFVYSQSNERIPLTPFEKVIVSGNIQVYMNQGEREEARVNVRGIDRDKLQMEVQGRTLKIKLGLFDQVKDSEIRVNVTYSQIREIQLSSGAQMEFAEPLDAGYLKVSASTGSSARLEGKYNTLEVRAVSGSIVSIAGEAELLEATANTTAEIKGSGFVCRDGVLQAHTGARIEAEVTHSADVTAGTTGEVILKGNPAKERISTGTGGTVTRLKP